MSNLIPAERIEHCILLIRGHKVMLDSDLARLYGVTTGNLNLAVRRNAERFPDDFMFRLTAKEARVLILQSATSKPDGRGGRRRSLPYAFTQEGVAMLSAVLRSERAVSVNIEIMRAFVRLRHVLASHAELARKLESLERRMVDHDQKFSVVFEAIRQLMEEDLPEDPPKGRIGFHPRRE
jgi:hypothetical protein